jgi:hypothetical protein
VYKVKFTTSEIRPVHLENFIKACADTRATIIKMQDIHYREYIFTISILHTDKEMFERISGAILSEVAL